MRRVLITRTSVLELVNEQFVVAARSKGLSRLRVLLTHILPNALNPLLSFLGIQIGTLMGGAIITDGGRVLCAVGLGDSVREAQRQAYALVDVIDWSGMQCRRDIGYRAIARED